MSVQEMKPIKEGKVREIFDNGDTLIMVATDRISCFDVILDNTVTKKGTVLTQMSKFWFDLTEDIVPNHMISADVKDMSPFVFIMTAIFPLLYPFATWIGFKISYKQIDVKERVVYKHK